MTARLALLLPLIAWCVVAQTPESRPALAPPVLDLDPEDPLSDLAGRMGGIANQLESGKSGPVVQLNQSDVIGQLDAMIAALKKKSGS
jgi:hypothetical protein